MPFQAQPVIPVDMPARTLRSTFALDLLTQVAETLAPDAFAREMSNVFGNDIPPHLYTKLQDKLLAGEVQNPAVLLARDLGFEADYDNRERVIRVDWAFFLRTTAHPQHHWWLLTALLHEFGHHIDNVLRRELSDENAPLETDAPFEEGHLFTLWMTEAASPSQDDMTFAAYSEVASTDRQYATSWQQACEAIRDYLASTDLRFEPSHSHCDREAFEAGTDSKGSTHQTIEWVLRDFNFSQNEIDAVYFGNWLRDYSQVVDPKITRAADMPKEFPATLSRESWTDLVDVLAAKKFFDLRMHYPNEMKVTPNKLGVYRPTEHIDNPLVIDPPFPDPKVRDPDFEAWVLPGDPSLGADRDTSMKRYIGNAVGYMGQELRLAMQQGRSLDGLRSFGAALHVLEDLFAHSNFAELSLIKAGYVNVLPWTTPAHVKWNLPLVTGTFGATDVIASLAGPLGKILFSTAELEFELTQPGYRSDRDKVMLVLLSEHPDRDYYNAFNALLQARDGLVTLARKMGVDTLKFYRWLINTPAGILLNAYNSAAQGVLTWIGNSVDDAQTLLGSDPNVDPTLEPSHSQLSKDHAEHPLHDLAALLATEAVRKVAQSMVDYWAGKPGADPVAVASAFFCHPADSEWQYPIVMAWAESNPADVARSESKSELDKTQQAAIDELRAIQNTLIKDSQRYLDYVFNSKTSQASGVQGVLEQGFMKVVSSTTWWKDLQTLIK
ncbi:heterokaryon incompatibility protein Het-C [Pseudomonas graminis]|uniref:HET-C-related protein n=1 Tax=Pseudomonas graminis TaxID=158627 RepID=UPI00105C5A27|nr:HET-C-related protein [Pseudomonas graminis]TDV46547.1 heterokaryon incompatibility protein Het-C [Pseudomonas graminis]